MDGQTFYSHELLTRLSGRRVRFEKDVLRGDVLIPRGRLGTLREPFLDADGNLVAAVELSNRTAGLDDYDNEVHWRQGVNLDEIQTDILVLPVEPVVD